MFWQFESATTSQIDTLVEKEDVTLAELMNEEDIIQECKSQNQKLIQFLIKPEITDQLVELIIKEPEDGEDEKNKYKKSNIACELLTCDVPLMNEILATLPVLNKLSTFIETDKPLNPLLASFFSKTMILVCLKKPESMFTFLKEHESFTENLIKHLETSALMDLLLKLSSGIDNQESRLSILTLLRERNILKSVYDRFKSSCTPEEQSNAATYLCDVIKNGREHQLLLQEKADNDPLLEQIESTEMVSVLLDNMFEGKSETVLVAGISVLQSLLEYKRHCANLQPPVQPQSMNESSSNADFEGMPQCLSDQQVFNKLEVASEPVTSFDAERLSKCVRQVHAAVINRLQDFHGILLDPPPKEPIETTVGRIVPLGAVRLEVAHLIRALVSSNNPEINSKLYGLKTFPLLIDLFFSYPWNNFLHTQVEHSIQAILGSTKKSSPVTSPNPQETGHEVAAQLFHDLIVEGQLIVRILDAFKPSETCTRLGYMGHLIKIANLIVEHGAEDPVKSYFETCDQEISSRWNTFVENDLKQINKDQRTPLVEDRVPFEDNLRQESALHNAFVEYQMQQMTRNLCGQIGFDTSDFTELDDLPIQAQADHLSKINFNIELESNIRQPSRSDKDSDDSSSDESPDQLEKPPGSFPVDVDQVMDIDRLGSGESTDAKMDTCEPWTSSGTVKTPEEEWADFDNFAAQRVSQISDTIMKDSTQLDPVEPSNLVSPPSPNQEVKNMEQGNEGSEK